MVIVTDTEGLKEYVLTPREERKGSGRTDDRKEELEVREGRPLRSMGPSLGQVHQSFRSCKLGFS